MTDGTTNATIPRGENVDEVDFARAVQLLADKRAKGPAKPKTTTKRAATTAKKTTTRTAAATKTGTAKTSTAKTGTSRTKKT